jgi:hypothetical protein
LSLAILASLLAVLAGCGPGIRYVFTPPASAEGRVCASQCLNGQQQCRMFLSSQYQACQSRWNYEVQLYNQCRANAPDKHSRSRCGYPPACYYPSTYSCDEQYRACYQLCGGQVQAIEPPG